ncbi:TOBE domain-containing protein, partial [Mesorhizobium sp. M0016]
GIPVTVAVVEPTGSEVQIIGRTAGGDEIVANFRERHAFTPGESIRLSAAPGLIHLFDGKTGTRFEARNGW